MAKAATTSTAPRLKALYDTQYKKELQAELDLQNIHQVPVLEKIVVGVGQQLIPLLFLVVADGLQLFHAAYLRHLHWGRSAFGSQELVAQPLHQNACCHTEAYQGPGSTRRYRPDRRLTGRCAGLC